MLIFTFQMTTCVFVWVDLFLDEARAGDKQINCLFCWCMQQRLLFCHLSFNLCVDCTLVKNSLAKILNENTKLQPDYRIKTKFVTRVKIRDKLAHKRTKETEKETKHFRTQNTWKHMLINERPRYCQTTEWHDDKYNTAIKLHFDTVERH